MLYRGRNTTKGSIQPIKPTASYTAAPLQINPDRASLYTQFQAVMQQRRDALEAIKQQDSRLYKTINNKWDQTRERIQRMPMLHRDRQEVMKKLNGKRTAERKALHKQIKLQRDEVRAKYPFKSWTGYLQHLATQGNETALAILRSKNKEVTAMLMKPNTTAPAVVDQITELLRRESPGMVVKAPKYTIDGKGTVIIKLPGGGSIRDTGTEIHYSANNDLAERIATGLAKFRWGLTADVDGQPLKRLKVKPVIIKSITGEFSR